MKKQKQKGKGKFSFRLIGIGYLFSIIALCISLVAYCDANDVLSWFFGNRKGEVSGEGFAAQKSNDFVKSIKVYEQEDRNNSYRYKVTPSLTYNDDGNGNLVAGNNSDDNSLSLLQYSSLEQNRSVLYLVELDDSAWQEYYKTLNISLLSATSGSTSLYATDEVNGNEEIKNKLDSGKDKTTNNQISNILRFFTFDLNSMPETQTDTSSVNNDEYYDFTSEVTDNSDSVTSFVTSKTENNATVYDYIGGSDSTVNGDVNAYKKTYEAKADVPHYVALISEYYPEAIEYIYSLNIDNEVIFSSSDAGLPFVSDITIELI